MSSLDDELALFESEMSSLVSDEPTEKKSKPNAAPAAAAPKATTSAPFVPAQLKRPAPGGPLAPPPMPPMMSGPIGPTPTGGPGPSGMFMPPTLRMPPPMRTTAPTTIESGPTLYKQEATSVHNRPEPKSMALPSDVEAVIAKRQANEAQKNSLAGQIARGEKKAKRYIRCVGGEYWEDVTMTEWDPSDFRIFCGDLGNEVSDELLAKAFRKYPSFQKAKVVREARTNKSKGYGFVSFTNQEDFVRAMREMDGKYVGNRPIKLRKSQWKDRQMEVVHKKKQKKAKLGLIVE